MNTPSRFVALVLGSAAALAALDARAVQVVDPAPHASQEPALTPQQAMLWKYTARCALRPNQELETPPGADGKTLRFKGALGLAPEWREGKCDAACQEKVSSCLAALTNQTGDHVNVSLMSAAPSLVHAMGAERERSRLPVSGRGVLRKRLRGGGVRLSRARCRQRGPAQAVLRADAVPLQRHRDLRRRRIVRRELPDVLHHPLRRNRRCAAVSCRDPKGRVWEPPDHHLPPNRIEAGNADALVRAVPATPGWRTSRMAGKPSIVTSTSDHRSEGSPGDRGKHLLPPSAAARLRSGSPAGSALPCMTVAGNRRARRATSRPRFRPRGSPARRHRPSLQGPAAGVRV